MSEVPEETRYFAERAHNRREVLIDEFYAASWSAGSTALKAGMLINGGAVVALLGLLSTLLQSESDQGLAVEQFSLSMTFFALGAGLSGIATGFTNWRLSARAMSEEAKTTDFKAPYVHDTRASTDWARRAVACQILAVVCGAITILMFFAGVYSVRGAMLEFVAS